MTIDSPLPLVSADDEWSPLRSVIVGRAEHSAFPSEPKKMIAATMPEEHVEHFQKESPFPADILAEAQKELDVFAKLLEDLGIRVYRPNEVDWVKANGYTGAMPRDGLMTVGNTVIEAPFAWNCRRREIELAYTDILTQLSRDTRTTIRRAPRIVGTDTLYDPSEDVVASQSWVINNSRPAFDTADFMRFGKTIIGQLSHVTNQKGVEYLQTSVPKGYTVEILRTDDEHAMHIDATLLPLRKGVLVFNPERVTEEILREHAVFRDWELHPYPFTPRRKSGSPPLYMCSPWLVLNALSLDERRIMVEASEVEFAAWLRSKFGMETIMLPFQHVNSIGGSFHCATVDLVRSVGVEE